MAGQCSRKILLGHVIGPSGLQGWLQVHSETQPREAIGKYSHWQLGDRDQWHTRAVQRVRRQGKRVLARLADCDDRDSLEGLVGLHIAVAHEQLETLAEGRFYWADLQGMQVRDTCGMGLGHIEQIFATGANDVIVVKGDRERLIPWITGEVVKAVDRQTGTVTVDWDADF